MASTDSESQSTGQNKLHDGDKLRYSNINKEQVTVVLPTFNERDGIAVVMQELRQAGYENILVVDGYSSDGTQDIARENGAQVVSQLGDGKAGAIRTAIEHVKTPYMLVMDADGTYNPSDADRMLANAEKFDMVIGYRRDRNNIPILNRIGNRMISLTFSALMGQRLADPCSGMYLMKTDMARELDILSGGFNIEVEIASQMALKGKVAEVPISYRKRIGKRKLKLSSGLGIISTVIRMGWMYNPVFFLSAIASLLALPGGIILFWQLLMRYLYGAGAWSLGWSWLGLVMMIVGINSFTVATISLLLSRMERRLLRMMRNEKN